MHRQFLYFIVFSSLYFVLPSCSSYMTDQQDFFSKFQRKQFKQAADLIKDKSEKEGKDQILFLLDRGTALFEDGDYKGAIDVFTKAEKLTEVKDYTSISEEAVSVVTTDKYKKFYPLDYELIMINVYLALSYYMEGKYDDAVVECRRINNLVYKLKAKGMKTFEESPFAWYLSASIYEIQKKYDDARIDYNRVMELAPSFKQAIYDTYRTARYSGDLNQARELEKDNPELDLRNYYKGLCKKCGDVVVIYSAGMIPIKRPSRSNDMLPEFYTRTYNVSNLSIMDKDGVNLATTSEISNLEAVARKNLSERVGMIVAKRILGIGTQVAIGYGVGKATHNEAIGVLAGLLVHATAQPDTRGWSTLPKDFQIARIRLPYGTQELMLGGQRTIVDVPEAGGKLLFFRDF
ncbi:MAG: hypothetical protein WCQ53_01985 [bacterium]